MRVCARCHEPMPDSFVCPSCGSGTSVELIAPFHTTYIAAGRLDADGNLLADVEDGAIMAKLVEHAQDPSVTVGDVTFGANVYVTGTVWIDDYDVFAEAMGLPDPLDLEREDLAADRANRQTLAWKYGMDERGQPLPRPHDPTSILDEPDPWNP